jgi:hypothetical protein
MGMAFHHIILPRLDRAGFMFALGSFALIRMDIIEVDFLYHLTYAYTRSLVDCTRGRLGVDHHHSLDPFATHNPPKNAALLADGSEVRQTSGILEPYSCSQGTTNS